MRIGFLGGDRRMAVCAACAAADGHQVALSHLSADELPHLSLDELFTFAEVLMLPLPVSRDGLHVFGTPVLLSQLKPKPQLRVFGGQLPVALPSIYGNCTDYYTEEDLLLGNARLTAEGAVATAWRMTERGFEGASAAILGFGRIGKSLCSMLRALGVDVCVYVRSQTAAKEAIALGYRALPLGSSFGASPSHFSVAEEMIFNTIPKPVLDGMSAPEALFALDLGGGLRSAPKTSPQLSVAALGGVPGLFAPVKAGELIYRTISRLL